MKFLFQFEIIFKWQCDDSVSRVNRMAVTNSIKNRNSFFFVSNQKNQEWTNFKLSRGWNLKISDDNLMKIAQKFVKFYWTKIKISQEAVN